MKAAKPQWGTGASTASPEAARTNFKGEKAAIVGNGLWGTIIAILVVIVLVIVILNLT